MRRPLVDQRLATRTPEHWPSSCTIYNVIVTRNAANQPITSINPEFPAPGMSNIPCLLGVIQFTRATDNETRTLSVTTLYKRRTCKLNGVYAIEPRNHMAVVDGVEYPIRGVETDSLGYSTRLALEVIQP